MTAQSKQYRIRCSLFGVEGAKTRINEGFGKLKSALAGGMMLSFTEEWTDDAQLTFTAKGLGQKITGTIDVFPAHVRIVAVLPGMLAAIAETITGKVEEQGKNLLEKK